MPHVPELRVVAGNKCAIRADGELVLYWMTAQRRPVWNFGLERAVEHARALGKPLLVLEALRAGYRWASDRLHAFVLQGMADNERAFAARGVAYFAYVERELDQGKGLLAALAARACVVVTDEFPSVMQPRMVAAAAKQIDVKLELVDSCGLLPMRAARDVYPTAYAFRRFLQRELPLHLGEPPEADPIERAQLPRLDESHELRAWLAEIARRWPRASPELLASETAALAALPIDHRVAPAPVRGGHRAGSAALAQFLDRRLVDYEDRRNVPDEDGASGLSPYLHFGHVSAHELFAEIARRESWTPEALSSKASGSKSGWWGMSTSAEAFLDQAITWRELGFNFASKRADFDQYASLPAWALETLAQHAHDPRPHAYTLPELERAETHDALWNAAQTQLVRTGRMHGYLRMLWGKKVLEWSSTPEQALAALIELNDKCALDGRDPNSYSGILWCLGRYDRPWGPERPIFGKVRYMSSENTARKLSVTEYLRRWAPPAPARGAPAQPVGRARDRAK